MSNVTSLRDNELEKLLATDSVIESICNWNAARYEQKPSHSLTLALLMEELDETETAYAATDKLGIIDGLGDTFFVAIGALWKTGLHAYQIEKLLDAVESNTSMLPPLTVAYHWYTEVPDNAVLALIALSAVSRLATLLESEELALDAIRAICVSNNTKDVVKTAVDVKANIVKGSSYVSPSSHLLVILAKAETNGL